MKLRPFLREYQRNRCYLCGRPLPDQTPRGGLKNAECPTREHVRPRANGGNSRGNILLAHIFCNSAKGSRDPYACEVLYVTEAHRAYGLAERAKIERTRAKKREHGQRRQEEALERNRMKSEAKRREKMAAV